MVQIPSFSRLFFHFFHFILLAITKLKVKLPIEIINSIFSKIFSVSRIPLCNGRDIKRPVAVGFQDAYQLNSIDLKEMNNFSGNGHLAIDDQYEKPQQYLPLDMKVA